MMRVLVISDAHNNEKLLKQIYDLNHDCTNFIFCGDYQYKDDNSVLNNFICVRGNNDDASYNSQEVINIGQHKFFITHGHLEQVEGNNTTRLLEIAKKDNCDIVCFGHTHKPMYNEISGIHVINPGSITHPKSFSYMKPTYAIITLNNDVTVNFYNAKTFEDVTDIIVNGENKESVGLFSKLFKK